MTFADAEAIRKMPGVQYVAGGIHENVARALRAQKRWFTRMHGTDVMMPSIKRAWTFTGGRFFTEREQDRAAQVVVLGQVVADKLFGAGANPVGQEVTLWNQPFEVVGVVTSATWVVQPAPGDDQFDAVYMPYTTTQRLLNLSKLNDITVTAASSGDVSRLSREITKLLRAAPRHRRQRAGRLHGHHAGDQGADHRRPAAERGPRRGGNVAELEKVTLEQLAHDAGAREPDDDVAAGGGGGGVAARRRHRHHEHHAAVGHRADARDRPAHGGRRARQGRDAPVPVRGRRDQRRRRRCSASSSA